MWPQQRTHQMPAEITAITITGVLHDENTPNQQAYMSSKSDNQAVRMSPRVFTLVARTPPRSCTHNCIEACQLWSASPAWQAPPGGGLGGRRYAPLPRQQADLPDAARLQSPAVSNSDTPDCGHEAPIIQAEWPDHQAAQLLRVRHAELYTHFNLVRLLLVDLCQAPS